MPSFIHVAVGAGRGFVVTFDKLFRPIPLLAFGEVELAVGGGEVAFIIRMGWAGVAGDAGLGVACLSCAETVPGMAGVAFGGYRVTLYAGLDFGLSAKWGASTARSMAST